MSRAWTGAPARLILDDGARHTAENAAHAAEVARVLGAREVVVVTSRWHAPRAALIFRWFLRGSGVRVVVATRAGPARARAGGARGGGVAAGGRPDRPHPPPAPAAPSRPRARSRRAASSALSTAEPTIRRASRYSQNRMTRAIPIAPYTEAARAARSVR